MVYDFDSIKEMYRASLRDEVEVEADLVEMEVSKVGLVKANCWKKIDENHFELYDL